MDDKQFYKKVCDMRECQKAFFRTHNKFDLEKSKALEKEIDAEIARRTNEAQAAFDKRQQSLNFDGY